MTMQADTEVGHPVKDQLGGVDFCVTSSPPWPQAILLGFQHFLVMLGTTVFIPTIIVPLMGGGNVEKAQVIQNLLFVTAINTLLQTVLGTRLPVVMGASHTFTFPLCAIALSPRFNHYYTQEEEDPHERFEETMRSMQGAFLVASFIPIILGFFGLWRILLTFLTPLSAVPLVTLVALSLYPLGFPLLANCIEIGLPALVILVAISQYLSHAMKKNRAIINRFGVIIAVGIVWFYAEMLTVAGAYKGNSTANQLSCRTDRSGLITASSWIRIPRPFEWGTPTVNAGDVFVIMAASIVSLIESTGTFIAASRLASATPVPPSVLSRGAGWQGIGLLLDGLFGTVTGTTASVENTGLLGVTRVGSRTVIQISAVFMLFFSVLGKFGAFFASIPLPIFAALYCVLFAYVASAGLSLLQFCNLNSFRTKFILGFSLFMGLSIPQYFYEKVFYTGHGPVHTNASWFNSIMLLIFTSGATMAFVVAYLLDCTLSRGEPTIRRDSGRHWWAKFRDYNSDSRSDEFYSLPYKLNNYFPSI